MDKPKHPSGYSPYPYFIELDDTLESLIREKIIPENGIFLDFGAGTAIPMIVASMRGLRAYGIEIDNGVFEKALNRISQARLEDIFQGDQFELRLNADSICEIANGSYYPKEYIELRENGESKVIPYENGGFRKHYRSDGYLPVGKIHPEEKNRTFHPIAINNDSYKKLGIKLNEVDVFFSFIWGSELPSHLELLHLYSKQSSLMISDVSGYPEKIEDLLDEFSMYVKEIDKTARHTLFAFSKEPLELSKSYYQDKT